MFQLFQRPTCPLLRDSSDWLYLYNKDAMFPYENGTTGIKNLDFNSFIQEQDISIPDIKTQQKIVSILSSIDEKIETNKRINDNLAS